MTWRINISNLQFTIPGLFGSPDIVLTYGAFLQSVINFLSIALALFICLKFLNRAKDRLHKNEAVEEEKEPELSKSEELLAEIRDLLKSRDKET